MPERYVAPPNNVIDMTKRRMETMSAVIRIREKELMDIKGPCSHPACRLHKDHTGRHVLKKPVRKNDDTN